MITELATEASVVLSLGQLGASGDSNTVFVCLGLGSCVALCAYDPVKKIGGMAHMVLPDSRDAAGRTGPKFVDCAIPEVIGKMEELGALKSRISIKIVGGAQMMGAKTGNSVLEIGERNIASTKEKLQDMGLTIQAEDTGGHHGRTARLHVGTGKLEVSNVGADRHEL